MPAIPERKENPYRVLGVDKIVNDQNDITDILRMIKDAKTKGIKLTITDNNVDLSIDEDYISNISTKPPPHPFKITLVGTNVNVRFGMVNSITPTGMDPIAGQDIIASTGYVVLAVTCNASGTATSAVITIESSIDVDTSTVGHIALGYVDDTAGTVSQSVQNSLQHQKCGTTTHLFGAV